MPAKIRRSDKPCELDPCGAGLSDIDNEARRISTCVRRPVSRGVAVKYHARGIQDSYRMLDMATVGRWSWRVTVY
jgi:hypothetical protein